MKKSDRGGFVCFEKDEWLGWLEYISWANHSKEADKKDSYDNILRFNSDKKQWVYSSIFYTHREAQSVLSYFSLISEENGT